mmetsp:Transcript_14262/g.21528  ORF Transcript_14262/g.21528 Transcript_14262/m.21528 type:complete len:365 (-) Transcript_14262:112-1206(-)
MGHAKLRSHSNIQDVLKMFTWLRNSSICFFLFLLGCAFAYHQDKQHLVVLVHGYSGRPQDLSYLARALEQKNAAVLAVTSNDGRTTDGVIAGGRRVAAEVNAILEKNLHFKSISILGNSLGGLYARYAIAELKLYHGLRPAAFVTTAAPHLGVKSGTLYGPLLGIASYATSNLVPSSISQTMHDLVNTNGILNELLQERYLKPLRSFSARIALAPLSKDFMVPFSSAFFTNISPSQFKFQAGTPRRISNDDSTLDLFEINNTILPTPSAAQPLAQLGWSFAALDLRPPDEPLLLQLLPLAHNKLVALERTGIKRLAAPFERTAIGQPVMDDLANRIMHVAASTMISSSVIESPSVLFLDEEEGQ